MRYLAGSIGCAGIFLLLMGLVFHAFILPMIKPRKKPFLEWLMIAAFGFGMYNSMATNPDRTPPRQAHEEALRNISPHRRQTPTKAQR